MDTFVVVCVLNVTLVDTMANSISLYARRRLDRKYYILGLRNWSPLVILYTFIHNDDDDKR